jgi:hypothetical protein
LGHKFTAFLLAAAIAFGIPTWLKHKASQSASTAELSFDSGAAQQIDPGLATTADPAIGLAHSILTDNVVAELSKQAYLSASDMDSRIGEFRSRLELTQPSGKALRVGFRDADPEKAAATVNAVARTLADWTPSSAAPAAPAQAPTAPAAPVKAPPAMAASQPTAPPAEPASKPASSHPDSHPGESNTGLSASLDELEAQLSATSRKLDGAGSSSSRTRAGHHSHAYQGSSYAQSRQQQLMKAEIRTAQKKLEDLRTQYANQPSDTGIKDRLAEIQQALTSVWPGAGAIGSSGSHRFYSAGVNASQIRSERAALTRAISVVARERHAIEQEADARPTPSTDVAQVPSPSSPPSASAPTPEPAAQSQPSPQPQPAPVPAPSPAASNQPAVHPLTLVRSAGPGAPILWWPSIVAGILCGLLYWGVAAWRNRPVDYSDEYDTEETQYSNRLITPDQPVAAASPVANTLRDDVFETTPLRRASFFYEPPPAESGASATTPSARADEYSAAIAQESVSDKAEPASPLRENVVEMADPWSELIKKAIAETDIARRFGGSAGSGEEDAAERSGQRSNRPDRLAG